MAKSVNPFNKAAREATKRGDNGTAERIRVEGKMADALIQAILDRGYLVTIDDGGALAIDNSGDKVAILAAMFSTDEDVVYVMNDKNQYVCWFRMIYGNDGHDVVSDYIANKIGEEIWDKVLQPLADELEAGMKH
jgi:hypothetical protein